MEDQTTNEKQETLNEKPETSNDKYQPKVEEWFTEDESDETMGIETIHYKNGGKSKKLILSDGRLAISSRLKGSSRAAITRLIGKDGTRMQDAVCAICTKIDDKAIVMEDLDGLWYDDLLKLQTMAGSINFI